MGDVARLYKSRGKRGAKPFLKAAALTRFNRKIKLEKKISSRIFLSGFPSGGISALVTSSVASLISVSSGPLRCKGDVGARVGLGFDPNLKAAIFHKQGPKGLDPGGAERGPLLS